MFAPAGSFSKRSRGGYTGFAKKDLTRDEGRGGENHFDLTPFFEAVKKPVIPPQYHSLISHALMNKGIDLWGYLLKWMIIRVQKIYFLHFLLDNLCLDILRVN